MAFRDIRLFDDPLLGISEETDWNTLVFLTGGGERTTQQPWEHPLRDFSVNYIRTQAALENFYEAVHGLGGARDSFRFKPYTDFKVSRQQIATGSGSADTYQITKTYTRGILSYVRDITLVVSGTLSVWINGVLATEGVDYTVDLVTGIITATVATGETIEVECEFDLRAYIAPGKFTITGLTAGMVDQSGDEDDIWRVSNFRIVEERP